MNMQKTREKVIYSIWAWIEKKPTGKTRYEIFDEILEKYENKIRTDQRKKDAEKCEDEKNKTFTRSWNDACESCITAIEENEG